jgi:hypothetical protein
MPVHVDQEELQKLVKSTLLQWHRPVELSQHPLTNLEIVKERCSRTGYVEDHDGRAKAVHDVLYIGIRSLAEEGAHPPADKVSGETCSCRCELYRKYFADKL